MKAGVAGAVRRLQEDPSWPLMTGREKREAAEGVALDLGLSGVAVDDIVAAMDARVLPRPLAGVSVAPAGPSADARIAAFDALREERDGGVAKRRRPKAKKRTLKLTRHPNTDSYIARVKTCTGMTDEELAKILHKSRSAIALYAKGALHERFDRAGFEALHIKLSQHQDALSQLIVDLEEQMRVATP